MWLDGLVESIQGYDSARLCLYGLPGIGKTAYAYWLAKQLRKPLQIQRGADILSQWVGGLRKIWLEYTRRPNLNRRYC